MGVRTRAPSLDRGVVVTRTLDAPRRVVFGAWTDARRLARWWGPNGFTNPVCVADVRPGGAIRIDMQGPDNMVYPMLGTFHEVVEPARLVFTSAALGDDGRLVFEVRTTATFAEHRQGRTRVTVRSRLVTKTAKAEGYSLGMEEGWSQSLDRLASLMARA